MSQTALRRIRSCSTVSERMGEKEEFPFFFFFFFFFARCFLFICFLHDNGFVFSTNSTPLDSSSGTRGHWDKGLAQGRLPHSAHIVRISPKKASSRLAFFHFIRSI